MVQLVECETCHLAKSSSPQVWMEHIATNHVIPTEWPSDRAKRLTGCDALRPYSTVADSKKKRKKDSIARPLNSFMIFSQYIRRNVLEVFKEHANADMSKQLGKLWGNLDDHFKDKYHEEAERMARLHDLEFPHYKYQPRKSKRSEQMTTSINVQCSNNSQLLSNNAINSGIFKHSANRISSSQNSIHRPLVQVTCSSQPRPQILQTSNPISVVSTSVPLILTSASAFNSTNQFEKRTIIDSSKHIVCKPITQMNVTPTIQPAQTAQTPTHLSYIANSDSAYSSEIGSSSNSSIPSPAIGDILLQSPIKHYIDDRNNTIHHWNVDNRRYYQTPRQASASSVPEIISSNGNNTPELKINRKRFYSGTNDCNIQPKLSCIPDENGNDAMIELDVVDQNGNKMKLRIENGSKEVLKSLLLSNYEKQQMNQPVNHNDAYSCFQTKSQLIQDQHDQINQQAIALENCLYINESDINGNPTSSGNFVEYVLPIQSNEHDSSSIYEHQIINQTSSTSPHHEESANTNTNGNNQSTILAFISDQYSQPLQVLKAINPSAANGSFNGGSNLLDSANGQLIMIKSNGINDSLIQFHANDLNNNNHLANTATTTITTLNGQHIKIEAELPSDLAALDTASLYRIN